MRRLTTTILPFLVLLAATGLARELPLADPAELGLSAERLGRLDRALEQAVSSGQIAGAVVVVSRRGRIAHAAAVGMADRERQRPMRPDTLFRIASMSKPITSTAVMMLYEQGYFGLDDPVSAYLPEFDRDMQVVSRSGEDYELVPAERPITIRHLLTHTSGISYRFFAPEPVFSFYEEAGITDGIGADISNEELVRRLARLPLAHQPGDAFTYGLNTDVLGRLVEVVAGTTLEAFLDERVFGPLGMRDTHFEVPAEASNRLAAVYRGGDGGDLKKLPDGVIEDGPATFTIDYPYERENTRYSGGAGLTSTAGDYMRFLTMIANGGRLDDVRILGRKTVELMISDQTSRLDVEVSNGVDFALGFSYDHGPSSSGQIGSPGVIAWSGYFNTDFFVDPEEELAAVLLTQHYPFGAALIGDYRRLVYQAIID